MTSIQETTNNWWLYLIRGLLGIALGIFLIASPVKTITVITAVVGVFLLIDAVIVGISAVFSIGKNDKWWLMLLQSVLVLILGVFVFNYPELTVGILFLVATFWLIISGIITIVVAITSRKEGYGGWMIAGLGTAMIVFSLIMLSNPMATVQVFTILFGLATMISGIMTLSLSFELKRMKNDLKKLN